MADTTEEKTEVEVSINDEKVDIAAPAGTEVNVEVKDKTPEAEGKADNTKDDAPSESPDKSNDHKRKSYQSNDDRSDNKRPREMKPKFNANIASRFDEVPESEDADEIRRQVEFYFSDSNLPIDRFLLESTGGYRNEPVPLKTIHSFKRMKHFQPFSAVRDAVKSSNFLILDDKDEITRRVPLDEKFTDDPVYNRNLVHTGNMPRSIYAKGFGNETKSTHLDIEAFFAPFGPINSVRLRRHGDGAFKGSVFVEFADEETQQRFLDLESKPQWDDKDLQIMSKQAYVDLKHDGIMEGAIKPRSPKDFSGKQWRGKGGRGRRGDDRDRRGGRDGFDKDDWKARRDYDQRNDRRGGRGRGRGGRDRGGRDDRRPASPEYEESRKRRRDKDDVEDRGDEEIKAKVMKVKTDEDVKEETSAGAGDIKDEGKTNGAKVEEAET